ncbi:MAG: DUF1365 domain-containing protein, partial [Desulfuromonas sp.]
RIYQGEVMHSRFAPRKHSFRYPVYFYALELDELEQLDKQVPLFGYNKLRPVAIHDHDYLTLGTSPIKEKLRSILAKTGITRPIEKVTLVTAARYFNYIFNPISFFYCHAPSGDLVCVVAQVNNTFGEMHLYPLAVENSRQVEGGWQFSTQKEFHVSPFFPRKGRYEFQLTPVGDNIDNRIMFHLEGDLTFIAKISGQAVPLTKTSLTRTIMSHPVCASLTMPRILWQAARLYWQRRLPVYEKPVPSSEMTIRPVPASVIDKIGMKTVMRFFRKLPAGRLELRTPDKKTYLFGQENATPRLELQVNEFRFFRRIMTSGDIGFGEAYTDGDWTTPDLPGLLTHLAKNESAMDDRSILTSAVGRVINYLRHLQRPNTLKGSDRNIREHYDLSNDFFQALLDPTMTYSCALFDSDEESLEQAQINKYRTIIEKAGITADDHVLEIGCGWGGFALEAVRQTGCRVTGITISREQLELAKQRVERAGLEDRIELKLCDYRHIDGTFDKIVSIEMLEAVGHSGLAPFFRSCGKALHPGGTAVIQVITISDESYDAYRLSSDWIRKHIFPGGHLPSVQIMKELVAKQQCLDFADLENFGNHYAETLDRWRKTLITKKQEILALGFDEAFIRKWEYYFSYCEAGFKSQKIDLAQLVLKKR